MSNCGCAGTWAFTWNQSPGGTYTINYQGFEQDSPYFRDDGLTANGAPVLSLVSACDGRYFDARHTYVSANPQIISNVFTKDDPNCGNTQYDCINGTCYESTTYNTPGLYSSLNECLGSCSSGFCSGVCIDDDEYEQTMLNINLIMGDLS
jgi:hypothetical protein